MAEGPWRGVFHQSNGADIPFNFEVKGKNAETARLYLINLSKNSCTDFGLKAAQLAGLKTRDTKGS